MLEREAQLERLDRVLSGAAEGRGGLAVVEAAAGLGKSALLAEASGLALSRDFRVLSACGDELESSFAFGIAIQLFGEAALRASREEPELVSGAAGLALPLLARGPSALSPSDPAPAFPLLHGLHWLTANLADRTPLLLAIDDGHWSDALSLRFLLYLLQRAEAVAVAVVLTVRAGEPIGAEAETLLARLASHPLATRLALSPLGETSVHELVSRSLPSADRGLGTHVYTATGGNPFLLRELLAAAGSEGAVTAAGIEGLRPDSIRTSILVRLARLGDAAARLAVAVATLGPAASLRIAADLAHLDVEAAAAAADALVAAEILAPGEPVRFVHPIIREVVRDDVPPERGRRQHSEAARLLHDIGAPPAEIASQLMVGEPVAEAWATAALRDAAGVALGRGDPQTAVALLRRAVQEAGPEPDPALLVGLGRAEMAAGEPAALTNLEAATSANDPLQRAEAMGALAQARFVLGDTPGAFEAVRGALDLVPAGQGGAAEAELLFHGLMAGRTLPALLDDVAALLEEPRPGPAGEPSPAEITRRTVRVVDSIMRGDRERATADVDWAVSQSSDGAGAEALPQPARTLLGFGLTFLGRGREADEVVYAREVERAIRGGSLLELALALEGRAAVQWLHGDVNACLADVETVLGLNDQGWETATVPLRVAGAEMLLERGDHAGAERVLDLEPGVEERLPGTWGWIWLPYGRARLELARAAWDAALEQALAAGERALEVHAPSPEYLSWRSLAARAASRLGETQRAVALAEEELELGRSIGSPRATGIALATLGVVRGGSAGAALLQEAVAELDPTEAELECGRARVELGMALRRDRRPREARRPLEEALDAGRRLGSTRLAELALGELRAAGGRPRRLALTGVESLTPAQRRVAELAAGGMSNPEIAEALFVTRRTVETHLTQVYGKLGIGSRDELSAALGRDEAVA